MPESLKDLKGRLHARQDDLGRMFEKPTAEMTAEDAKAIIDLDEECKDLAIEIEQKTAIDALRRDFSGMRSQSIVGDEQQRETPRGEDAPQGRKSLGELIGDSAGYKQYSKGGRVYASSETPHLAGEMKATFTTTASTLTGQDRQPGVVMVGTMRLMVADLLAQAQTTMPTVRYVQEDTYVNAATTVAEGALKPEATFDTSEQDAPVRKIGVTAKVTDEIFADFPAMRDYVNARLPFMVQQVEETQLLTGDGIAPNILGILNASGIQTQAKATDKVPDAIYKGIVKVRYTGFFEPDGYVTNPADWQDIRLLTTADGIYLWGAPSDPGVERIWGLPVVVTTAMTQNTGLVGAFRLGAQIFYRQGMTIETTNSNEDDFKRNLIAIRAEQREALAIYRPKSFCTITGI